MDTLKDGWSREGANGCFTHLYGLSDTHVLHRLKLMMSVDSVTMHTEREGGRAGEREREGRGGGADIHRQREERWFQVLLTQTS